MLAVHLIRAEDHQTLITLHPSPAKGIARTMQDRIFMASNGIYWGRLMRENNDPIFVVLIVMWSALYVWDEAMEVLYSHITQLETRVIEFTPDEVDLSPQLHAIRAHLLYYDDLLQEFLKGLEFIQRVGVKNEDDPASDAKNLLNTEVQTLSNDVERLRRQCSMQDSRLDNAINLMFNKLSFEETSATLEQTRATLEHGKSMKLITYLRKPTTLESKPTVLVRSTWASAPSSMNSCSRRLPSSPLPVMTFSSITS